MPNKTLVKTHYPDIHCETILTEVYPEKRLKFTGEADAAVASAAVDFAIEDGKTYIVSIDREDYEAVAASGEVKTDRGSISTEAGQMTVKLDAKEAGSHTVRVTTSERTLCKIPEDFLPEHLQFGETVEKGDTLTWDGNTEGLVNAGGAFYKVSDAVLTDEQIKGCSFSLPDGTTVMIGDSWDGMVASGYYSEDCVVPEVIAFARKENATLKGITFPEPGIYCMAIEGTYIASVTVPGYGGFESKTVTPLDEKYMPILTSPGGKKYKIAVADDGTLTTTAVS